jgi:hypothetical protein
MVKTKIFVKRDMGVNMIDLWREICKPVLKQDFTSHGVMESLSEFGLWRDKYKYHLIGTAG